MPWSTPSASSRGRPDPGTVAALSPLTIPGALLPPLPPAGHAGLRGGIARAADRRDGLPARRRLRAANEQPEPGVRDRARPAPIDQARDHPRPDRAGEGGRRSRGPAHRLRDEPAPGRPVGRQRVADHVGPNPRDRRPRDMAGAGAPSSRSPRSSPLRPTSRSSRSRSSPASSRRTSMACCGATAPGT